MSYVIRLKMNEKNREAFNEQITEATTRIILALAYVPFIFLVGTIYLVIFQRVGLGAAVCKLLAYTSIIGFLIMGLDAVDNWLSLKWDDIEAIDKKKEIKQMAIKSIIRISIWIWNFVILGIVL